MHPARRVRHWSSRAILLTLCLQAAAVRAGRPFVTDDAGVVGDQTLQVESWIRVRAATLEHFGTLAFGPIDELELSAAAFWAISEDTGARKLSIAGPTLQAKLLGKAPDPGGAPGVAAAVGFVPRLGTGPLEPLDSSLYTYLASTESPLASDALLIHASAGFVAAFAEQRSAPGLSWGLGLGCALVGNLSGFAEAFASDPTVDATAIAGHAGLTLAISDGFFVDATFGTGLSENSTTGPFATVGLKFVSGPPE